MKKLAYLALALISVLALGSCKISITPGTISDYGDNYIKVVWYGAPDMNEPKAWSCNDATIESNTDYVSLSDGLSYISEYHTIASGSYHIYYTDYLNNNDGFDFTIPTNTSYSDKHWILYLAYNNTDEGRYLEADVPYYSIGTVK